MKKIEWNEKYVSGNLVVDKQHKELFRLLRDLQTQIESGTSQQSAVNVLLELIKYTESHFLMEEHLQTDSKYPKYPAHKQLHEDLKKQVVAKVVDIKNHTNADKLIELCAFLESWITHHICNVDFEFITYLNSIEKNK